MGCGCNKNKRVDPRLNPVEVKSAAEQVKGNSTPSPAAPPAVSAPAEDVAVEHG